MKEGGRVGRAGKTFQDEVTNTFCHFIPPDVMKDGVALRWEYRHLLDWSRESFKESSLRFQTNHPVASRPQHECRSLNCARVRYQSATGVMKIKQQVDRDLTENQRV